MRVAASAPGGHVRGAAASVPVGTCAVGQLDDGRVRVTATSGDRRVELIGPEQIAVGETARFTAEVAGVEHWVWFGPDGGVHVDVGEIDVGAGSAGAATLRLRGVDGQNRPVEVVHRLDVV